MQQKYNLTSSFSCDAELNGKFLQKTIYDVPVLRLCVMK